MVSYQQEEHDQWKGKYNWCVLYLDLEEKVILITKIGIVLGWYSKVQNDCHNNLAM